MSMGPVGGIAGSAAGAPLSQTKGSESEAAQRDQAAHGRQADTRQQAEKASGIGQTEQDQQTSQRDADGRRLWEQPAEPLEEDQDAEQANSQPAETKKSKDVTGNSGTRLDLTG